VSFGTGTGMLSPVSYGQMVSTEISAGIDAGQQASLDRSNGLGGQFDFTVAVGPLCLVACYLIINPGASYQNSISTTEIDLQDVNGDGYADSLQTTNDNLLTVRANLQADTNLLATVQNPLGGTITLTYERDGNTVDNPSSVWSMTSVEVNDGRSGDGIDLRRTTFSYAGLKADRLHRASLGYAQVTETELDTAVTPAQPVRSTVHAYLNDNVFVPGWRRAPRSSTCPTAATSRASSRPGRCATFAMPAPTSTPSTAWPRSATPSPPCSRRWSPK